MPKMGDVVWRVGEPLVTYGNENNGVFVVVVFQLGQERGRVQEARQPALATLSTASPEWQPCV